MAANINIEVSTKRHWLWYRVFKFGIFLCNLAIIKGVVRVKIASYSWKKADIDWKWEFLTDEQYICWNWFGESVCTVPPVTYTLNPLGSVVSNEWGFDSWSEKGEGVLKPFTGKLEDMKGILP